MNSIQLLSSKVTSLLDNEPNSESPSTISEKVSNKTFKNTTSKSNIPSPIVFSNSKRSPTDAYNIQVIRENEDELPLTNGSLPFDKLKSSSNAPQAKKDSNNQNDTTIFARITVTIFNIIIFIPSVLIFKPSMKLWSLLTFPLRFLEEKEGSKEEKRLIPSDTAVNSNSSKSSLMSSLSFSNNSYNSIPINSSQNNLKNPNSNGKSFFSKKLFNSTIDGEYDDVATIYSMATNTTTYANSSTDFKSPTSTSHIMYLLSKLPKPFFAPLNFNPAKYPKKTLILDLDETLIHSLSRMPTTLKTSDTKNDNMISAKNKNNTSSSSKKTVSPHMVEVRTEAGFASLYYVYKRPFCDEFLRLVSNWFDVYIFTASTREYADPVVNFLEKEEKFFQKRFYREHCTYRKGAGYIKDLSVVGSELSKVILVDNSPISYSLNYENAIDIEGWIDDPTDSELLQLLPILNALRFVTDVRYVLGLKNGEDIFRT